MIKLPCLHTLGLFLLFSVLAADPNEQLDFERGIVVLVGLPEGGVPRILEMAEADERLYFCQVPGQERALAEAAEARGLLSHRVVVDPFPGDRIPLADNLADAVIVSGDAPSRDEILRVLRPLGEAFLGDEKLVKPVPEGLDEWSHPYHGPDNNPQSSDRFARGKLRTQFIAMPKFSPMPQQTVIAGGRMYKAMGHIAHKANQNPMLNTLICVNAYNGTRLWERPLPAGFMIHRNTMVATADALYLGDSTSCKVIDGKTGTLRQEITIPKALTDGPVWKWMAQSDGMLYALVGNPEIQVETEKSVRRGLGHWPWGMWKGHEYADPKTSFGFGRTLVAIDLTDNKRVWHYRDEAFLDARGMAMNDSHIFCYAPEKFLAAIDRKNGKLAWKNSDDDLMQALGPPERAQHWVTGYATSTYLKCNAESLFFSGPQRKHMVVASAEDGHLSWTNAVGNLQLILRDDAIYAAGSFKDGSKMLDYRTGDVLETLPGRRACTRATGSIDSIFYRAQGGTVRVLTEGNTAQHIAPMRPPCQDGVLISNGHLYWGPWMCGCQLSLYGNIALAPQAIPGQEGIPSDPDLFYDDAHRVLGEAGDLLGARDTDWTQYRGGAERLDRSAIAIPGKVRLRWKKQVSPHDLPTGPVTAGNQVFIANRSGVVESLDASSGRSIWKAYTAGPVFYPPAISRGRVYVGSADGRVYCYNAKDGRALWAFRVGPRDQMIKVFDKLISSWPLSGGVVVTNRTVYAAAGIAHYGGTYVVALDAESGQLKAQNSVSGTLSSEVESGISLQGNLQVRDGELQFLAGGVYETARYDLETLESRNSPKVQIKSQFRTAFYPYYPDYNKYVSLEYTCEDGRILNHDANYEGLYFNDLALYEAPTNNVPLFRKDAAGEFIRNIQRRRKKDETKRVEPVWQDEGKRRFNAFIIAPNGLLAAGHPDERPNKAFLALIDIQDGADRWIQALPVPAVKGGVAMDAAGRIFLSLENGELRCYTDQ